MSLHRPIEKFIIVTQDMSGEGFAKILLDQGNEVILALSPKDNEEKLDRLDMVAQGVVDIVLFEEIWKNRSKYKDWAWIFDMNFDPK
jgi:hypothetical protein